MPPPWGLGKQKGVRQGVQVRWGSSWQQDPSAGWRGGQTQALAVAAVSEQQNESRSPSRPPAPLGVSRWEAGRPRLSVRPAGEALVADRVGARVRGLLLLCGLVAGVPGVGRGWDPQRRLTYLQAEGLA